MLKFCLTNPIAYYLLLIFLLFLNMFFQHLLLTALNSGHLMLSLIYIILSLKITFQQRNTKIH